MGNGSMQIPIDVRKAPFKPKYLDEETYILNRWFVFGGREDGTVDISYTNGDIFIGVTPEKAERIIKARNEFCDAILNELTT